MHMLIVNVDDDLDDREMFLAAVDAIEPKSDCIQFDSGKKFLDYIDHGGVLPDVIFLDINMPKMNGYECVEKIRPIPGSNYIQIVMYSTSFNPLQQHDLKDSGIRYVTKTSKFSELIHSIKSILLDSMASAGTQKT